MYTLRAHVDALMRHVECAVVGVGAVRSPVLETLRCSVHQIYARNWSGLRELPQFFKIVRTEKPDVIHAFDTIVYLFSRVAARWCGCGLVLTICGGPNPAGRYPRGYVPLVNRLVLLSEENETFIRSQRRFRKTRVWRIPNRVNEVECDNEKILQVRSRLNASKSVILRIGRFDAFHQKTALQCVRLVRRLSDDGIPAQLVLLGTVQDWQVHNALVEEMGAHGIVITDGDLVKTASAILDVGDLVVGTGRSLMEAASRGRVVLAPVFAASLPALVTETNWRSLFRANFSGRAVPAGWGEDQNYAAISRALTDKAYREQLAAFSRSLFEKHFSLEAAVPQYLAIYRDAKMDEPWRLVDLALHWASVAWRTRRWVPVRNSGVTSTLACEGNRG